jgi:hypothetical protein
MGSFRSAIELHPRWGALYRHAWRTTLRGEIVKTCGAKQAFSQAPEFNYEVQL